ncbi:MAG TPA: hypothetical protein VHV26_14435 [Rhizomicrobium sp.]|nr:hypothetical protein [Rhizomicrobium sp.]
MPQNYVEPYGRESGKKSAGSGVRCGKLGRPKAEFSRFEAGGGGGRGKKNAARPGGTNLDGLSRSMFFYAGIQPPMLRSNSGYHNMAIALSWKLN